MRPEISPTLRVLVVEDERLIRWALTQALGDAGAAVVEASDAHSAIAALRDEGEWGLLQRENAERWAQCMLEI